MAYAKEIVPEPRVAAMREKIEPLVPPALNFLCTYLDGDNNISAYFFLLTMIALIAAIINQPVVAQSMR